jgi:hypothetical protein
MAHLPNYSNRTKIVETLPNKNHFNYCLAIIFIYLLLLNNNSMAIKIFGPNSFSQILYYFFRTVAILIVLFALYLDISFMAGNFTHEKGRYYLEIPLTETLIEGDYTKEIILTISLGLYFGSLFFFVLSNIFKALKENVIFNRLAIRSLSYFTFLNLAIGPLLYVLIHFFIMRHEHYRDIHNLILHLIFGVIALFLTHIFKRGVQVQSENDLTI